MKCLKEPLSRMVNKAGKCTGAFFEGRFESIGILDEEALLSVCAYIDLNPVAAGIAAVPEKSDHTSVKARVEHVKKQGRVQDLQAARWQRGRFTSVKAIGRGVVVDSDRGSPSIRFAARRDAQRFYIGQLSDAG